MLRTLLLLFAVLAVPDAVGEILTGDTKLDISSCPITYFGQKYEEVYINFTSDNFVVCFDGFYSPQTGGDCVLGPPSDQVALIMIQGRGSESAILQRLPTIKTTMKCFIDFSLYTAVGFGADSFGSQAALVLGFAFTGSAFVDVLLNGNKVHELRVTNTETNLQLHDFLDVSGCRHGGVVYKPGTTTVLPERCETVDCSETAVLSVSTCGPMQTCLNNMCGTTTTEPPTTTTTTTEPPTTTTTAAAGPTA